MITIDVKSYDTLRRFAEQDAQLRENQELRPEVLRQRRAQLADTTRQAVTETFDRMIARLTELVEAVAARGSVPQKLELSAVEALS